LAGGRYRAGCRHHQLGVGFGFRLAEFTVNLSIECKWAWSALFSRDCGVSPGSGEAATTKAHGYHVHAD
jgi:hypothetical protein